MAFTQSKSKCSALTGFSVTAGVQKNALASVLPGEVGEEAAVGRGAFLRLRVPDDPLVGRPFGHAQGAHENQQRVALEFDTMGQVVSEDSDLKRRQRGGLNGPNDCRGLSLVLRRGFSMSIRRNVLAIKVQCHAVENKLNPTHSN